MDGNNKRMFNNFPGVKLFDSRFLANTLNNSSRCPRCRNEYSYNYDTADKFGIDYHVKSNRPILLPCGHNMCENCVYHNRHNLTCAVCLAPVMIPKDPTKQFSNFNVRDYFDMNFFLMGQLYHWRYYRKDGTSNNSLFMSAASLSNLNNTLLDGNGSSVGTTSVIKCVECEDVPSLGKCRTCKAYYCKRCFDNVHRHSKVLKMHTLQNFNKEPTPQSEILRLTKSRFCKRHHRYCDRYCKKCDIICCGDCARNDHQYHHFKRLIEENEKLMEDLRVTFDNTQLARENLNKGQKDIKSVETEFEDYAAKTLEEISNYFVQLHSFLQNEEKKIMEKFSEMSQQPQFILRQTNLKLNESQETLNTIRSTLEQYQHTPPSNVYLGHILPKYNQFIQQLPSNIQLTKPYSNPFVFEIKHDVQADIQKAIDYKYKDPNLIIKIDTSFYDSNPSILDTTSTASISPILDMPSSSNSLSLNLKTNLKANNKSKNKKKKQIVKTPSVETVSTSSVLPANNINDNVNLVKITNIKSPENFYVQNINDMQTIRNLSHTYLCNDIANNIPKTITEGYYYMAYHAKEKQWYRGMLKQILPNDLYKIFLVDFGLTMDISKDNLCDIEKDHLKMPFAAIRCAIYDIIPASKKWTEVENSLLLELLQNKPARISIIEKVSTDMLKIDLHTDLSKSVRNTFLYTGLARERPGIHSFKLQAKVNLPILKIDERIPKINMTTGEMSMVTVAHVEGPNEFYIIKNELVENKEQLKIELNQYYFNNSSKLQQIYLGTVQMCCAVILNDVWYRALIEEINDRGQLNVRLVDEGRREFVNWRQVFVLIENFRNKREFAIPCTLADIEPLQENNYVYTAAAVKDFKQMITNPQLRMEVVAVTSKMYKVALYISKKELDINIGATLVKDKYGVTTGEFTQVTEILKTPKFNKNNHTLTFPPKDDNINPNLKQIKRTPINVTYMVDPGKFYIQLTSLAQGTKIFHQQIQEAQTKKCGTKQPIPCETREWFEDNHCLVYTKYYSSQFSQQVDVPIQEEFEWYRGVITKITYVDGEEPTYSVFLRDIGVTICSIYSQQLYSIDQHLDRVTNAVYCCHLACIEPAGGKHWSQSATDSFTHHVMNAEAMSVSLHGKPNPDRKSLPIVLWNSKMETANPLAPCITKYSNINRYLVRKGLAHMVEPLDTKQQFDEIEKIELQNGEITLEQWFKSFSDNVLLKDIESNERLLHNSDDNNELYIEDHSLLKYLNDIDCKETTGQKAPSAWFTPKVIAKTLFAGYPTYVDYDCVIYLHEADDKKFLEQITNKLTETYGSMEPPSTDAPYAIDQACIVKYHLDGKFYRGIITSDINSKKEWSVFFIDYGNVERVKSKDMRPYAPFPNLPAMASKYILDGIKPISNADKFITVQLDQMHTLLVTKFVSIRTHPSELNNTIKRCSMRLGPIDVASDFIERGLAEGDYKSLNETELFPLDFDLPIVFSQEKDVCIYQNTSTEMLKEENDDSSDNIVIVDDDDDFAKFDHINEMMDRLSKNVKKDHGGKLNSNAIFETTTANNVTSKPPPKKRMFNENDYTKMMNAMKVYDTDDIVDNFEQEFDPDFIEIDGDDDEDIVELNESFAMNYWHNAMDDMREEEEEEIKQQLERRVLSFDEDIESEFDGFNPNETSTAFSHFSGFENFKPFQLPSAMHHFNCRIAAIITPMIWQIFPNHNEFRYRDVELQRSIKELVKQSLPPLTNLEPHTPCLALYSKDKHWYRAIIRSYNPTAKGVDVLYVDYLNSETVPLKYVRQCPQELLGWPLRTFSVRLHGLKINPNIKEYDICSELRQLLPKRNLFGVIKKRPTCDSLLFSKKTSNKKADLIEIALYESKEASLKGVTVYEPLIEKKYFRRI